MKRLKEEDENFSAEAQARWIDRSSVVSSWLCDFRSFRQLKRALERGKCRLMIGAIAQEIDWGCLKFHCWVNFKQIRNRNAKGLSINQNEIVKISFRAEIDDLFEMKLEIRLWTISNYGHYEFHVLHLPRLEFDRRRWERRQHTSRIFMMFGWCWCFSVINKLVKAYIVIAFVSVRIRLHQWWRLYAQFAAKETCFSLPLFAVMDEKIDVDVINILWMSQSIDLPNVWNKV